MKKDLTAAEQSCLQRIAHGQAPTGEPGEASTLVSLTRKGLIERRLAQALPLENRRYNYVLTAAGRRASKR